MDTIKGGVAALATDIKVVVESMKQVQETQILNAEPRSHINDRNVTPLGMQHKRRLEGTRVGVVEEIWVWAGAKESMKLVYCIGDVADTGRSTVARTLYDTWAMVKVLIFSQREFYWGSLPTRPALGDGLRC